MIFFPIKSSFNENNNIQQQDNKLKKSENVVGLMNDEQGEYCYIILTYSGTVNE